MCCGISESDAEHFDSIEEDSILQSVNCDPL